MFGNTVTLFNFHEKDGLWYPSVIRNADLIAADASRRSTGGINNADTVDILINCTADKVITTATGSKPYIAPRAYAQCDDPADKLTFRPECDFIYDGIWGERTPIDDDRYAEGLYHAVNNSHDGVYMITSAAFYGLLPHFEIGGR